MYKKLSIIIPVFNEEKTIREILEKVEKLKLPLEKEIIVIDDGSSDKTREILKNYQKNPYKVIFHEKNKGKGSAIRTGIKNISGDIVIVQDADLEYDPNDFIHILEKFNNKDVVIVYGTRFPHANHFDFTKKWIMNHFFGAKNEIKRFHLYFGVQLLNFLSNTLYNAKITDEATCYKAFRSDIIKNINLKCTGFEFCPEVTAKVRKAGHKIHEVPISYHPRSSIEGKKLNWKHGVEAIWTLVKYRFID